MKGQTVLNIFLWTLSAINFAFIGYMLMKEPVEHCYPVESGQVCFRGDK